MLLFSENYGIMKKMREIRRNLSMAFCTNCGAKLADDAKFCTECGAPVGRVPPEPTNPQTRPVVNPAPAALTSDDTYSATANDYT